MRELKEQIIDSVVIVDKEVIKTKQLVGSINLPRGTKAWEFNKATKETVLATFESVHVEYNGEVVNKLVVKDNHRYVCALNQKNAERKFKLLEAEDGI